MTLDEYLRAGLHEEVDAVLYAAARWRSSETETRAERLRETIHALAEAWVRWNEAVEEFRGGDGTPAELKHGRIVL